MPNTERRTVNKITRAVFFTAIIFLGLAELDKWLFPEKIIVPRESRVVNVPEIQPFLAGRAGFRGLHWNLDSNYISFAFSTTFKTTESYFAAIHEPAKSTGWRLTGSSINQRIYKKIIKDAAHSKIKFYSELKVVLSYDPNKFEVTLELIEMNLVQ